MNLRRVEIFKEFADLILRNCGEIQNITDKLLSCFPINEDYSLGLKSYIPLKKSIKRVKKLLKQNKEMLKVLKRLGNQAKESKNFLASARERFGLVLENVDERLSKLLNKIEISNQNLEMLEEELVRTTTTKNKIKLSRAGPDPERPKIEAPNLFGGVDAARLIPNI